MNKKTILLVDQDKSFVSELQRECRRLGLLAKTACSAYDALAIMDDRLPDLVCLDVNIPTGHTLSICEMMVTDPKAAKIPIIAITERKDSRTVQRCGDMCAYFVQKSEDMWERLEPVIYELIDIDPPRKSSAAESESDRVN